MKKGWKRKGRKRKGWERRCDKELGGRLKEGREGVTKSWEVEERMGEKV